MTDEQRPIEEQIDPLLYKQAENLDLNQVVSGDLTTEENLLVENIAEISTEEKPLVPLEELNKEPEDIFGVIDSLKVEDESTSPSKSVVDAQAAANPVPASSKLNFIFKLVLIVFVLGVVVLGVVLAYPYVKNKFFGEMDENNIEETTGGTENDEIFYNFPEEEDELDYLEYEEEVVDDDMLEEEAEETSPDSLMVDSPVSLSEVLNGNNNVIDTEVLGTEEEVVDLNKDTDNDGLTDEEEKKLGTHIMKADTDNDGLSDRDEIMVHKTNPLEADSDGDGLSDYDEVNVYKTDPLNPDSDGDTYFDGIEVSGGYNPNGPGKL
jgi:hypothetical protein